MADDVDNEYWLLDAFTDFYQDLARVKSAARNGRLAAFLGGDRGGAPVNAEDLAAMVQMRLKSRLDRQAKEVVTDATEFERRAYYVAQYAMAAVADEVMLLDLDWPGRASWSGFLLERALFGSAMAGQRLFSLIEKLLRSRNRSVLNQDLASVFLIALQLGFRGECQGESGDERLGSYRRKLLAFVDAGYASRAGVAMFPQAYAHTVTAAPEERLSSYLRWYRLGLWLAGAYLAASSLLWLGSMERLSRTLDQSELPATVAASTPSSADG